MRHYSSSIGSSFTTCRTIEQAVSLFSFRGPGKEKRCPFPAGPVSPKRDKPSRQELTCNDGLSSIDRPCISLPSFLPCGANPFNLDDTAKNIHLGKHYRGFILQLSLYSRMHLEERVLSKAQFLLQRRSLPRCDNLFLTFSGVDDQPKKTQNECVTLL
jgi:hypothetical protein